MGVKVRLPMTIYYSLTLSWKLQRQVSKRNVAISPALTRIWDNMSTRNNKIHKTGLVVFRHVQIGCC